ncbi:hypothetical protein C8Q76DRAFT_801420 [Earliella scabrosa]|nr:hypothetical protein C8Q76DRAFT_801420 [Earliella scabrosa]
MPRGHQSGDAYEERRIHAPAPRIAWPRNLLQSVQPVVEENEDDSLNALLLTYPPADDEAFWAAFKTPELVLPAVPDFPTLPPRTCTCGITGSLVYRRGPYGPNTKCNKCGGKYKRHALVVQWRHGYIEAERRSLSTRNGSADTSYCFGD